MTLFITVGLTMIQLKISDAIDQKLKKFGKLETGNFESTLTSTKYYNIRGVWRYPLEISQIATRS